MANNGDILIAGTKCYAIDSISMSSAKDTHFNIKNNSLIKTENTEIKLGSDAFIQGQGGGGIKQNKDGSISFFT